MMTITEAFVFAYVLGAVGNFAFMLFASGELPSGGRGWLGEAIISLFPALLIFCALLLSGVVISAKATGGVA